MRPVLVGLAGLSVAICGANAQGPGDATKGEALFKQQCQVCHRAGPGADGESAPSSNGIRGQKAGAVPDYSFSPAMMHAAGKGIAGDKANLNKYLDNPQGFLPGTKMAYLGLKIPRNARTSSPT